MYMSLKQLPALISLVFVAIVIVFTPDSINAQTTNRFAQCDLCGYCNGQDAPGDWNECAACVYPDIPIAPEDANPLDNYTLEIKEDASRNFVQVTPYQGRMHTMLGCLSTNIGDFNVFDQNAGQVASPVINTILNMLFRIAGGLAFLYLLYGSYVVMTSRDNPEQVARGRATIIGSIVGVVFALSATLILNFIGGTIGIPGFGGQEQIGDLTEGEYNTLLNKTDFEQESQEEVLDCLESGTVPAGSICEILDIREPLGEITTLEVDYWVQVHN